MAKKDHSIRLKSREYKVMLDHLRFHKAADKADDIVSSFWSEVKHIAESIGVEAKKKMVLEKQRTINFFDTPDHSFRKNGLVFAETARC